MATKGARLRTGLGRHVLVASMGVLLPELGRVFELFVFFRPWSDSALQFA